MDDLLYSFFFKKLLLPNLPNSLKIIKKIPRIKSEFNNIIDAYNNVSNYKKFIEKLNIFWKLLNKTPNVCNTMIIEINSFHSGYYSLVSFKSNLSHYVYAVASKVAYDPNNINLRRKYFESEIKIGMLNDNPIYVILVRYRKLKDGSIERYFIFSFRGTQPTNLSDIKSDLNILINNKENDDRFKYCLKAVENFINIPKYKNSYIVLTGHSLGGSIAMYIADKLSLPCIVFNPGSSIEFNINLDHKKLIIHKIFEDIICASAGFVGSVFIYKTRKEGLAAHTLDNFLR